MKKYKKTYAIYHLAEKHTVFYLGKTKVHVSFTGGIITKKGVTPATFTTTDPIVQLAIENSGDFKKGVIRVAASYAMDGEVTVGVNPVAPDAGTEAPKGQAEAGITAPSTNRLRGEEEAEAEAPLESLDADGVEGSAEADEAEEPTKAAPTQQTDTNLDELKPEGEVETAEEPGEDAKETGDAGGLETVDASCKDVAKQYLQEHFGENPAKLRTREDVQKCAALHGITFNFV